MRRARRGRGFAVKDLRTWPGTVLAAAAVVDADPPVYNTTIKNGLESAVMKEVAEELDNFLPWPAHQPIRNVAKGWTEPMSHHGPNSPAAKAYSPP